MTQNDSEINMQQIALEVVLPFKFPPKKKKKTILDPASLCVSHLLIFSFTNDSLLHDPFFPSFLQTAPTFLLLLVCYEVTL